MSLWSRGAFIGFEKIGSQNKHLYTHGRHEWTVSNSADALYFQRQFYEQYLHRNDQKFPKVQLEVRQSLEEHTVRHVDAFPLTSATSTAFFLDASSRTLGPIPPIDDATASYESTSATDGLSFRHTTASSMRETTRS